MTRPPKIAPARIAPELYAACGYFFPRLMFLHSDHAAQIHWGDIVLALQDFPLDCLDLGSAVFWDRWMQRWAALAEDYCGQAQASLTAAGRRRLYRSASACWHWAEFMYFSDPVLKTAMRTKVKECFQSSLDPDALAVEIGWFDYEGIKVPFYLIQPPGTPSPLPCMILCNGLDSVTEVEIFAVAELFLARGMAVFLFDGPGQGINLGLNPLDIRAERIADAIVDVLAVRRPIDLERLGYFGISFGGYLALRVAALRGSRFRCVVNLSGGPSLSPFDGLPRRLKEDFRFAFQQHASQAMQDVFDHLVLDASVGVQTDVLSVHGALDDIFPLQPLQILDRVWGPRHRLKIYESEAHVCLNYIAQYSVEIADWAALKLGVLRPQPSDCL